MPGRGYYLAFRQYGMTITAAVTENDVQIRFASRLALRDAARFGNGPATRSAGWGKDRGGEPGRAGRGRRA